ncbi:uncharacterized protein EV420DRAFT_1559248 [Desarmillaria tabescens]|uniref:Uncharacterized protein n=1 Tax=Armillaria tabescens TaxID=1929756 RepID=A0AA39K073_ARMTA|nr:uncharacterized protein EV420DRAFT_1559248 [Desarmillaria tabescens]KAK0452166.1 hypothetical protein EV420DRAFT_1559248 [Desarmillaria tabescens]
MGIRSLFVFVSLMLSSTFAQQHNLDPAVNGSGDEGWQWLPEVVGATMYPEWVVDNDKGAYLPVYQTAGLDSAEVTRAVIVLQGKQRDCWSSWNAANNALYDATYNDTTIQRSQISIMGPCFLTEADLDAAGQRNVAPDSVSGYSSFNVLDSLVSHYMDRSVYPNLKVLVVGGHSAGGQMAQRYATLRISTDDDDRLHFWVANPASLCWLTSDRPIHNDACEGYDAFKYGLDSNFPAYATKNARALGRDGIIKRYYSRTLNYAWGLEDQGNGDTRCQAQTQGHTRLERGQNFVAMLENMGGIPNLTTIEWVPGVGHSAQDMMASDAGIDKVGVFISRVCYYV